MLGREEAVLLRPGDQHRPLEGAQALRRLERVAGVEPAQQAHHVAPHPGGRSAPEARSCPPRRARSAAWTASRRRSAAGAAALNRIGAKQRAEPAGEPRRREAGCGRGAAGSCRRRRTRSAPAGRCAPGVVVAAICVSAPPVSLPTTVASSRSRLSRAPVISPAIAGTDMSAASPWALEVRAQRQVERDPGVAVEQRDDLAPQVRVHQGAVHEDDRRALAGHVRGDPVASDVERPAPGQALRAPPGSAARCS